MELILAKMKFPGKLVRGSSLTIDSIGEWPASVAILAMAATIVVGVTSRYVFNHPLFFVEEYNGFFNVAVIFLPLAYVIRHGGHLRLDTLVKALPQRAANYLEIATNLVSLGLVIILDISVTQEVMSSFATGEESWGLTGTPLGPVQLIMPIGLSLFALQIIVEIVKRIKTRGALRERIGNN